MKKFVWRDGRTAGDVLAVAALIVSLIFNGFVPRLISLRGDRLQPVLAFSQLPLPSSGADFAMVYTFTNSLLAGLDPYELHPERGSRYTDPYLWRGRPRFDYPPLLVLLFLPFAGYEFHTAYHLWLVAQMVLLCLAIVSLASLLRHWRTRILFGVTAFQLVSFSPDFWLYLERGQPDLALLLLLSLSLIFLVRRRHSLAAVLISSASLLKPYPFILLALFPLRRQWRAAAWGGLTLGLGLILSLAWLPSWLSVMVAATRDPDVMSWGDASLSLHSAIQATFAPSGPVTKLLIALDKQVSADLLLLPGETTGLFGGRQVDWLANYGSLAIGLVLAGILCRQILRLGHEASSYPATTCRELYLYALGVCIMLLVPTVSWSYRMVWACVFVLFAFSLAETKSIPWPHLVFHSVVPPLVLVYLPPGWGRWLVGCPLLLLYLILQVKDSGRVSIRFVLQAGLGLAVLVALPVGKAWLLVILTLYYVFNALSLFGLPAPGSTRPASP